MQLRRDNSTLCMLAVVSILFLASADLATASKSSFIYSSQSASVRAPSVALQAGNEGSSTISPVAADAATVTVSSAQYLPYIAITLTNPASSATVVNLQQKVTFAPSTYAAYESGDLGNIRFCADSGCATPLYAWLEGCSPSCTPSATSATAWVVLQSAISGGGGTLTIYMAFQSHAREFDGNYWGEMPQLSGTYGQYDNGAKVFAFYDGFAGTSLSAKWTVFDSAAGTVAVNNGLTLTSSSTTSALGIFASYAAPTTGMVTETYFNAVNPLAGYRVFDGNGITSSSTSEWNGYVGVLGAVGDTTIVLRKIVTGTQTNLNSATDAMTAGSYYQNSLTWQGNALSIADLTSGNSAAATDSTYALSSSTQVSLALGAATGSKYTTYWYRVRFAPPSNTMPTVAFGSITGAYILAIVNQVSSSWNANLGVASSSNIGRMTNLTIWFYSPVSTQIRLGTLVTQLTTGPVATLPGSGTLYIALQALTSSSGSSTVTLSLKIRPGSTGPYAQYTILLTVN
jgi:hypothetical protein